MKEKDRVDCSAGLMNYELPEFNADVVGKCSVWRLHVQYEEAQAVVVLQKLFGGLLNRLRGLAEKCSGVRERPRPDVSRPCPGPDTRHLLQQPRARRS